MKATESQLVHLQQTPKRSKSRWLEYLKDFSFAVPALVVLTLFIYYPLLNSLYLSFTNWNMTKPVKKFIGFDNYVYLLTSDTFYKVLKVTFTYTIFDVLLTLGLGLLLALLFNSVSKFFGFMRAIIFMPHYISMVIVSMIFLWIFNGRYGLVNELLNRVGLEPIQWLTNTKTALWVLVLIGVWKGVGFTMIIFIAGLRSIPIEYYEASGIDGASKWTQFWKITLPLLSPTTLFLVVTHFISSMQVFQSVDVITNGGPLDSTKAMVYWIYEMAFTEFRTGRASALVIMFFLIIVLLTMVQMYVSKKKVHYEG
ncbi:ABC-type sugar transport system permease subunit [Paenibacillus sp. V4I3]|uniref:carbohydrate ABC transporter permease n=1 Tax=unclassified Paenibacillus TaxID=185978 RepID=UPI002788924D|nr:MULTISPECIES: sugar ABC transporter permease [unclassified Paenibacillus]MDQ0878682.1 ABC-type sugar transport system permease subunit [Paenibacillus sp. V4I3]MDQ0885461.1 ABC-type sugar transport system permease subunit [Paenibacillus sp. V4I9]